MAQNDGNGARTAKKLDMVTGWARGMQLERTMNAHLCCNGAHA